MHVPTAGMDTLVWRRISFRVDLQLVANAPAAQDHTMALPSKRHLVVIPDGHGGSELHRLKQWVRRNPQELPASFDPAGKTSRQMRNALRKLGWVMDEGEHEVRLFRPADRELAELGRLAEPEREDRTPPKLRERAWVRELVPRLQAALGAADPMLEVRDGYRLAYSREILTYHADEARVESGMRYETDLLVAERAGSDWTPRVVVEAKLRSVTTHDAITYSQKAATHKHVHPYLRYGIFLGARKHHPLPGRLFRHGAHFDFMLSWRGYEPTPEELDGFARLLIHEVNASRLLQDIMFNTRARNRAGYWMLHKPVIAR